MFEVTVLPIFFISANLNKKIFQDSESWKLKFVIGVEFEEKKFVSFFTVFVVKKMRNGIKQKVTLRKSAERQQKSS